MPLSAFKPAKRPGMARPRNSTEPIRRGDAHYKSLQNVLPRPWPQANETSAHAPSLRQFLTLGRVIYNSDGASSDHNFQPVHHLSGAVPWSRQTMTCPRPTATNLQFAVGKRNQKT